MKVESPSNAITLADPARDVLSVRLQRKGRLCRFTPRGFSRPPDHRPDSPGGISSLRLDALAPLRWVLVPLRRVQWLGRLGLPAACLTPFALCSWPFALLAAEPPTYYVNVANPTPVAPYMSWETAATNIQEAIDAGGEAGRLVLVTNGVYRTGWVDAGFGPTRVALASWEQAPVVVQSVNGPGETIIEGSRMNPETGEGEDVRCVYVGAGAVLSGFTLRKGYAIEGGGAYCSVGYEGTPPGTPPGLLTNCVLTANSACRGGGVFGGTLHNCTLTGNSVWGYVGGHGWGEPGEGGGAYNSTLHNCILTANVAAGPLPYGGAGGGAYGSQIHNSVLTGNSADYGGGVMGGTLSNCTLTGNSARAQGGGALGVGRWWCNMGCIWSWGAEAVLRNCVVYFNTAPLDSNWVHCLGEHTCTMPLLPGAGNIDLDPQLVSATHLATNSPCSTAGSAAYATGTDIDGDPWGTPPAMGADQPLPASATGPLTVRVEATYTNVAIGLGVAFVGRIEGHALSCEWDFGDGTMTKNQPWTYHAWSVPGRFTVRFTAYNGTEPLGVSASLEVQVDEVPRYYVDAANATPAFPYMTWATAATNIQEAIDAGTLPGRSVVVTNGVYRTGSVETNGWNRVALLGAVMVRSVNGPAVTSIEGGWSEIRCAYVGPESMLSGFTLTSGGYSGAALSAGVLTNCVLTENPGVGASGGTLYDCVLTDNSGAGVSGATLYNCKLTGNTGSGAVQSTLYNCTLTGNSAEYGGGARESVLHNCTLTGNSASEGGGAAHAFNCTLTSASRGGGAYQSTLNSLR